MAEFLHGAIYFVGFHKKIFWNCGQNFLWPLLGVKSYSYTTILLILQENGTAHEGDHETIKLTKDVSWEEEEEEVTEHYLKIYAKYITDGQVIFK